MAEREYVLIAIPIALIFLFVVGFIIYQFYPKPFQEIFNFAGETLNIAKKEESGKAALAGVDTSIDAISSCLKSANQGCSCDFGLTALPEGYVVVIQNRIDGLSFVALDEDEVPVSSTAKIIKDTKMGIAVIQKVKKEVFGKEQELLELGCVFPGSTLLKGNAGAPFLVFEGNEQELQPSPLLKVGEKSFCLLSNHLLRTDYPGGLFKNSGYPYQILDYYEDFERSAENREKRIVFRFKEPASGGENLEAFTQLVNKEIVSCRDLYWPLVSGKAESCKGVPGLESETALVNTYTFSAAEDSDVVSIVSGKLKEKCSECAIKMVEIENERMKVRFTGFSTISPALKDEVALGQVLGKAKTLTISILDHEGNMVNPICLAPQSSKENYLDSCKCSISSVYPELLKLHPNIEDCNPAPLERAIHCSAILA